MDNKRTLNLVRRCLFLVSAPIVFINFALPLRAEDLGASAFQIGILFALFTGSILVVRPIVGYGLDKIGRRPFFILATLFYFAANILYGLSETVMTLYIARLFHGIGFAFLAITAETITSDLTERDGRSAAMGGNIASQTRGGMVGGFVGFGLVGALPLYAWGYSFAFFSVTAAAAIVFAYAYIPETKTLKQKITTERFQMPKGFPVVLGVVFFAAFAGAVMQPYYLIYLRERFGLELYELALAFLPIGVAYAILPVWLGRITSKLQRTTAIAIGLSILAGVYAAIPNMTSLYWVIGGFMASSIGGVLAELTKSAWIGDLSPAHGAGRTFGIAALAAGVGAALGPLAGGMVYDQLGKEYLFYFAALSVVPALLLVMIAQRAKQ